MRRKTLNISLGFVISILMTFSATQQVLAQCNWSTKVTLPLPYSTNAVPGLTASGDRLILTFAMGSGIFFSRISFDGINWSNPLARSDFPRIVNGYRGGLGMTYSPACGYVYASWRDGSNNMWATRSVDGINWEAPRLIVSATVLSAPALRGDNGSLPIGFAFSTHATPPNTSTPPEPFEPFKGKFNCDFSNIVFPIQARFFSDTTFNITTTQLDAIMPVWTGAGGTELSALAEGSATAANGTRFIRYQVNNSFHRELQTPGFPVRGTPWSNNGVAGTVDPNDGIPYIVWTCHPDDGDTCKPESSGKINIFKMVDPANSDGVHRVCADWSMVNPAVTFFQGKIWLAWRGGGTLDGKINIASLNPF